jgi:hypothetical protein
MKLRTFVLAGALALVGLAGSPNKADAQVWFGYGNPYANWWANPYAFSTPMYGYWGNPYWSSPLGRTWGFSSPYWYGRTFGYTSPFLGTQYGSFYYANPGWGPGAYSYRFGRWVGW